ncbi:MAG: T9SS type A sorting domain-containing protein [Bacteroidales bacterium]|nr:T9SS type A sorting domain-containing protein [Bacteroidales bacterium]
MYGIEGTPESTWTWASCNTPRYTIPVVDTSVVYIVKVRAECFVDSLYYGEWDSIRLGGGQLVEIPIVESAPVEVLVHPNPTHGSVQVLSTSQMNLIEIYDLFGRSLGSASISGTQIVMDVRSLKPATYLLRIHTDSGWVTKKLVVD